MRVSVIITNYNYGLFVGGAIQSAKEVRCEDKEIIVCDDGSTDNSRSVIESFGDSVISIFKPNNGQPSAANIGFARSTGDIIFFLDSDDMLQPDAAEKVMAAWYEGVSKVQFPMLTFRCDGSLIGGMFPNFSEAHSPEFIRQTLLRTGHYPTPPTTGNAYARSFLQHVMPVPEGITAGFDGFLNIAAPFYGDVLTLLTPLAKYRMHNKNSGAQTVFTPEKLAFYIEQDLTLVGYLQDMLAKHDKRLENSPLLLNTKHQMDRVACYRLAHGLYPIRNETRRHVLMTALKSVIHDDIPLQNKVTFISLMLGIGLLNRRTALWLAKMNYSPSSRPRWLVKAMQTFNVLRRPPQAS